MRKVMTCTSGLIFAVLAVAVITGLGYALGNAGVRTAVISQKGTGYTITCHEDRGVYDYYDGVALSLDGALVQAKYCLEMRIKPEWGK